MPCYDGGEDRYTSGHLVDYTARRLAFFEAVACMLMKHVSDGQLTKQDYKNAGVTREAVDAWWKQHREEDAIRFAEEKEEARIEKIRTNAINKLTKDERFALGL